MSTVAPDREDTYLPEAQDQQRAGEIFEEMEAGDGSGIRQYLLLGHEPIELTEPIYRALREVVAAMRQGRAVTVAPVDTTLTTQQAADFLGISRPTLVKLLDSGQIDFDRPGSHRRVRLVDLLEYRRVRRAAQYEAISAMSAEDDDDEDPAVVLQRLASIRARHGELRRSASAG